MVERPAVRRNPQRAPAQQSGDAFRPGRGRPFAGNAEGAAGERCQSLFRSGDGLERMQGGARDPVGREAGERLRPARSAGVQGRALFHSGLRQGRGHQRHGVVGDRDQHSVGPARERGVIDRLGNSDECRRSAGVLEVAAGHRHHRLAAFSKQAAERLRHAAGAGDTNRPWLGVHSHRSLASVSRNCAEWMKKWPPASIATANEPLVSRRQASRCAGAILESSRPP